MGMWESDIVGVDMVGFMCNGIIYADACKYADQCMRVYGGMEVRNVTRDTSGRIAPYVCGVLIYWWCTHSMWALPYK